MMKVELTQEQVKRYKEGENALRIVEEVALATDASHVYGYGLSYRRIVEEAGKVYATWNIYDSCD